MKKIICIICSLFIFTFTQAQNGANSLIKNSQFHFFDGTFQLSYEKSFSSNKSINISGGFHLRDNNNYSYSNEKGWVGELQLRRYLLHEVNNNSKLSGFFVAPYIKGAYFSMEEENYYYDPEYDDSGEYSSLREIKSFQGGVLMGYQMVFSGIVSLELFLGGGMQYADSDKNYYSDFYQIKGYTGVVPRIGFNVGVSF